MLLVRLPDPNHRPESAASSSVREDLVNHHRYLHGLARSIVGNKTDAEDLVQETCRRALEHAQQFVANTNLRGWLTSILRNVHRDRLRRSALEILSPMVGEHLAAGTEVAAADPRDLPLWRRLPDQALVEAVRKMPALYREVYALREDGWVYGEIARKLNISVATVATRIFRARAWLRDQLLG